MSETSPALDELTGRLRELGLDGQLDAELGALQAELRSMATQMATANDDLAAAAVDLESMGTELERAATELSAVNDELEQRSDDVERVTGYLQSVIDGVDGAVVVVDVDQKVRAWSAGASDRWGATRTEVSGRAFGRLDLHGETPDLLACVRSVLAGEPADEPTVVADSGARARAHPLLGADGALEGAVVYVTDA